MCILVALAMKQESQMLSRMSNLWNLYSTPSRSLFRGTLDSDTVKEETLDEFIKTAR